MTFLARERVVVASTDRVRIEAYQTAVAAHASETATLTRVPCEGGRRVASWCVVGPARPFSIRARPLIESGGARSVHHRPGARHPGHGLWCLQPVSGDADHGARRCARDAGAHDGRRPQLPRDAAMDAVRSSLRGDRRTGSAHRTGARRAVRVRARTALDRRGRLLRRRRARLRHRSGPRRAVAARRSARSRATEIGPVAGLTAAIAILFIIVIALAGVGVPFVNALSGESVGRLHDRATIPLALLHESLHVPACGRGTRREATVIGVDRTASPRSCSAAFVGDVVVRRDADAVEARSSSSRWPSTASWPRSCRSGCSSRRATTSARS